MSRAQARFDFRARLAVRRGYSVERARALAERLTQRDAERDDRRCCMECKHVSARSGRCRVAVDGRMPGFSTRYEPVLDVLQRCPWFAFEMPQ